MTAGVAWKLSSLNTVLDRLSDCVHSSAEQRAPQVGNKALLPHQLDAISRIDRAIGEFGGAVLADDVGLGKTLVAIAVAQRYQQTLVLAPATLVPMWRQSLFDANASQVSVVSLHKLSQPSWSPPRLSDNALVVVDEAHHVRNANTRRHHNASSIIAGRDTLLLSATPLHNNATDLRSLMSLFLGKRTDALESELLERIIVRRTHAHLQQQFGSLPRVIEHEPWPVRDNPQVLDAMLRLPPPLPTRDGGVAGALVQIGLLRAWCSSDAALAYMLRRRRLRGEALRHSLYGGRLPSRQELASWAIGTDSIQLGFIELLVSDTSSVTRAMVDTITRHLDSLAQLEALHLRSACADADRVALLRRALSDTSARPLIAFSHFAATVQHLYRALSGLPGLALLTASGGVVAGGKLSRRQVIETFAPSANQRPPPPPQERIVALFTTDILSEGVNLQDAQALVHLDLPWTDAAKRQRVGRLARFGSPHDFVHEFQMAPPAGIERTLRIVTTLERKARLASALIGRHQDAVSGNRASTSPSETISVRHASRVAARKAAGDSARQPRQTSRESPADAMTRLHQLVANWRTNEPLTSASAIPVAVATAAQHGWLAAVDGRLIGGLHGLEAAHTNARSLNEAGGEQQRSPLLRSAADLLVLLEGLAAPRPAPRALSRNELRQLVGVVLSAIDDLRAETRIVNLTGTGARSLANVRSSVLRRIAKTVQDIPPMQRRTVIDEARCAEGIVVGARGSGAERELEQWAAQPTGKDDRFWLGGWRAFPSLVRSASRRMPTGSPLDEVGDAAPEHIGAVLLLVQHATRRNTGQQG